MSRKTLIKRGDESRRGVHTSPIPTVKDAPVDVILQRIDENVGNELEVIPKGVRRYGVNNIFQRTLSYLIGKTSAGTFKPLVSTVGGVLKVASVGAGLERSEIKTGTALAALSAAIEFTKPVSRLHVGCTAYELYLYHSPDGVTFYGPLHCYDYYPNVFDITCKAIKVQRAEGNDVDYDIAVLW